MTAVTEHVVMKFDDIKPGEAKKVDVDGHLIAVVRLGDALFDLCAPCCPANDRLSEGEVFDDIADVGRVGKEWRGLGRSRGGPLE
jgi:nitrite reductase/ring-hydroxylating ferredoxin subunit